MLLPSQAPMYQHSSIPVLISTFTASVPRFKQHPALVICGNPCGAPAIKFVSPSPRISQKCCLWENPFKVKKIYVDMNVF